MIVLVNFLLVDVNRPRNSIDGDERTECPTLTKLQVAILDLHLLHRIAVAIGHLAARRSPVVDVYLDALDELQAEDGVRLVDQVFLWQFLQPPVLPNGCEILAAVEVEQVREKPSGLLLSRA